MPLGPGCYSLHHFVRILTRGGFGNQIVSLRRTFLFDVLVLEGEGTTTLKLEMK